MFHMAQTLLPDPRSLSTYECCSYIYITVYPQHPVFVLRTSRLRSSVCWRQQGVFGLFCKLLKVRCCGNHEICFHRSERLKCLCAYFHVFPSVFYSSSFSALSKHGFIRMRKLKYCYDSRDLEWGHNMKWIKTARTSFYFILQSV